MTCHVCDDDHPLGKDCPVKGCPYTTPTAAEARATIATDDQVEYAVRAYERRRFKESLSHRESIEAAINAVLSLPPPEEKETENGQVVTPSTIDELEALLNSEDKRPVRITPDGRVVPEAKDGAAPSPEMGYERVPLNVLSEASGLSAIDVVALEQRIGFLYRQLSVAPETTK